MEFYKYKMNQKENNSYDSKKPTKDSNKEKANPWEKKSKQAAAALVIESLNNFESE